MYFISTVVKRKKLKKNDVNEVFFQKARLNDEKILAELPCQRVDASTHHELFLQGSHSFGRKMLGKSNVWLPAVGQSFR